MNYTFFKPDALKGSTACTGPECPACKAHIPRTYKLSLLDTDGRPNGIYLTIREGSALDKVLKERNKAVLVGEPA